MTFFLRHALIWGWLPLVLLSPPGFAAEDLMWLNEEVSREDIGEEKFDRVNYEGSIQNIDREPVASVTWHMESIEFAPKVEDEVTLTVVGPDFVYQDQGRYFFLFDIKADDGTPLIDGTYRYELRQIVEPSEDTRLALVGTKGQDLMKVKRQLRREGRWPPPRPLTQKSVFFIENGMIKAPAAEKGENGE